MNDLITTVFDQGGGLLSLGQTVEKPMVQPGKTVPRKFPQFFQAARGFSTVSQTLLTL